MGGSIKEIDALYPSLADRLKSGVQSTKTIPLFLPFTEDEVVTRTAGQNRP
jgi:hypothetical protein